MSGVTDPAILLRAKGVSRIFEQPATLSRRTHRVIALQAVDLEIAAGTSVGIVGASGSGKSTLARCLAGLDRPTGGQIWLEGTELGSASEEQLRRVRPQVQLILQDAATALNPRMTAVEIVSEPLLIQGRGSRQEHRAQALAAMEQVGLRSEWERRRPQQFSGGQRQRLAIARSLVLCPKLLILDEALSGLDVALQAQLLALLRILRAQLSISCIMISHDLGLVAAFADELIVMGGGTVVERGRANELLGLPRHPATRALVRAMPRLGRETAAAGGK